MNSLRLSVTLLAVLTMVSRADADAPPAAPAPSESPAAPAAEVAPRQGAKAKFDEMIHDFGKVMAADLVKHSFIFTNVGDQTLFITNVIPTCGCTTAGDWTRQVEPGQTGTIPIGFHGSSYSGLVQKVVTVQCNDRQTPTMMLQLKAYVWRPVEVTPQYAVMTIPPDADRGTTKVRILNNTEEPLSISPPQVSQKAFTAELTEITTNQPGKEFQLVITAGPGLPQGSSQAQVTLKTSATNMPTISVTAIAYSQPAVSVMPPQVGLPAAPLANRLSPSITIMNNCTNKMTLSEPAVSMPGIDMQVRELQPGKTFIITLGFPQGYEMPEGKQVVFTAKTDNPRMPEIRVPVLQSRKPATATRPNPPVAANPPATTTVRPTVTTPQRSAPVAN